MKKELVKIVYEWWGNANIENRMWTAILPDESALDYGTVKQLIAVCEKHGYDYYVLRTHRGGKNHKRGERTVLQSSLPLTQINKLLKG